MTDTIEKPARIQIRPRLRAKIWEELRILFRRYENTADILERRKIKTKIAVVISLLGVAAVALPLVLTEAALSARADEEHSFGAFSQVQEDAAPKSRKTRHWPTIVMRGLIFV